MFSGVAPSHRSSAGRRGRALRSLGDGGLGDEPTWEADIAHDVDSGGQPHPQQDYNACASVAAIFARRNGNLGFAYFTKNFSGIVHCGEVPDQALKPQALPMVLRPLAFPLQVVCPTNTPDWAVNAVVEIGANISFICASEFCASHATDTLKALWPRRTSQEWACRLAFDRKNMLSALGGLLTVLLRRGESVDDILQQVHGQILSIPRHTLDGLQIFRLEPHPAAFHGLGKAKEGLSIFSLINRCRTAMGKELLRRWCLLPTSCPEILKPRYGAVAHFSHPNNRELLQEAMDLLRFVKDPTKICATIRKGTHTVKHWEGLLQTCRATDHLLHLIHPLAAAGVTAAVTACSLIDINSLRAVSQMIAHTIDFSAGARPALDRSSEANRNVNDARTSVIHVRSGVDPQLDEYRQGYASLDNALTIVAQREAQLLPPNINSPVSVVFFPQVGYLICLAKTRDASHNTNPPANLPPTWELTFQTSEGWFFKHPATRDLDENVGDLHAAIAEQEGDVLRKLDADVLAHSTSLAAVTHLAEVDALCAFAVTAVEEQWSMPVLKAEGDPVQLRQCRHPLLSRVSSAAVIPFNFSTAPPPRRGHPESADSPNKVTTVTGPNSSGKSVLIRAVALTVYLAHIGSFVPCEAAEIPPFDAIYSNDQLSPDALMAMSSVGRFGDATFSSGGTNICAGTTAPITEVNSSFGQEIAHVGCALRDATSKSLIVLDEFGCGTLATDGVALLSAILLHFTNLRSQCPFVLLATHFTEVFSRGLVPPESVQRIAMRILLSSKKDKDENQFDDNVVFLYEPGPASIHVAHSNALSCARGVGLAQVVTERARELMHWQANAAQRNEARGSLFDAYCATAFGVPSADHQQITRNSRNYANPNHAAMLSEIPADIEAQSDEAILAFAEAWKAAKAMPVSQKLLSGDSRSTARRYDEENTHNQPATVIDVDAEDAADYVNSSAEGAAVTPIGIIKVNTDEDEASAPCAPHKRERPAFEEEEEEEPRPPFRTMDLSSNCTNRQNNFSTGSLGPALFSKRLLDLMNDPPPNTSQINPIDEEENPARRHDRQIEAEMGLRPRACTPPEIL